MLFTNTLFVISFYISLTTVQSLTGKVCRVIQYWWSTNLHTCLVNSMDDPQVSPLALDSAPVSSALVPYEESVLTVFHEETRQFVIGNYDIVIHQDWKTSGVAAVVWDAAVVLSEYLVKHSAEFKGKTVLELGAGTGLAGIVAAKIGAKVTLTDREVILHNLHSNVDSNSADCTFKPEVKELDWGQSDNIDSTEPLDFVIGADIIYIEETFPLLLNTLNVLASPETQVLLSCRIRYERDSIFLDMMKEQFEVTEKLFDTDRGIYVYNAVKKKA